MGVQLRHAYELVQVETGLEGNFLERDFGVLGCLATHSWMKLLWEYLFYYDVKLEVEGMEVPGEREREVVFMEVVVARLHRSKWGIMNRVRKSKGIYFLSQAVGSYGRSFMRHVFDTSGGPDSTMTFPREEPGKGDYMEWRAGLQFLFGSELSLQTSIGRLVRVPYRRVRYWSENNPPEEVVEEVANGSTCRVFGPIGEGRRTRSSGRWGLVRMQEARPSRRYEVTAVEEADGTLVVVSTNATRLVDNQELGDEDGVMRGLMKVSHPSLWKHAQLGPDDGWIRKAIAGGSLCTAHDGSYMNKESIEMCAAALVVFCVNSGRLGTVCVAEKTDHHTASNYRGEALGGC